MRLVQSLLRQILQMGQGKALRQGEKAPSEMQAIPKKEAKRTPPWLPVNRTDCSGSTLRCAAKANTVSKRTKGKTPTPAGKL
ncbi:hypothetical protein EFB08_21905 [Rufibacter latericius]|uniref:Uncharacterized protein n=1 Tax=Rufibacter latericius TaxID=2487040 RepID=A0A3M9M9C3_9BACT|nr:hypothetical protein EFB08_21905 [Rufibacter latericius]